MRILHELHCSLLTELHRGTSCTSFNNSGGPSFIGSCLSWFVLPFSLSLGLCATECFTLISAKVTKSLLPIEFSHLRLLLLQSSIKSLSQTRPRLCQPHMWCLLFGGDVLIRDTASATEEVQHNCVCPRTALTREIRVALETGPRRAHRAPAPQPHHTSPSN